MPAQLKNTAPGIGLSIDAEIDHAKIWLPISGPKVLARLFTPVRAPCTCPCSSPRTVFVISDWHAGMAMPPKDATAITT